MAPGFNRFGDLVCEAIARRSGRDVEAVARVGTPLGVAALERWRVARFLGESECAALKEVAARPDFTTADIDAALSDQDTSQFLDSGRATSAEIWDWPLPALRQDELPPESTLPPDVRRDGAPTGEGNPWAGLSSSGAARSSEPPVIEPIAGTPAPRAEGVAWSWASTEAESASGLGDVAGAALLDDSDDDEEPTAVELPPDPESLTSRDRFRILGPPVETTQFFEFYVAHDRKLDRGVTLMVPRTDGPLTELGFIRSARMQASIQHPNVQPVYDIGRQPDGRLFAAVAETLPGTLADVLRAIAHDDEGARVEWPTGRLLEVVLDVARAIAAAHERGVMHRDVRPSLVRLGEFGEVHVVGWMRGSLQAGAPDPQRDADLSVVDRGLGFLAPERLELGLGECGPAADVWGLGALLYAVLTHRPPLSGRSSTEVLAQVKSAAIVPPRERRPMPAGFPPSLERLCLRALRRSVRDRRITAATFASDLEQCLEGPRAAERRQERAADALRAAMAASEKFATARRQLRDAELMSFRLTWSADPEAAVQARDARVLVDARAEEAARAFQLADANYAQALQEMPDHEGARHGLCGLHAQALRDAEYDGRPHPTAFLRASIAGHDPGGFAAAIDATGRIEIHTDTRGVSGRLHAIDTRTGVWRRGAMQPVGPTPFKLKGLPPGPYLLELDTAGGPVVRLSFRLRPAEHLTTTVPLCGQALPTLDRDWAYVPPGEFHVGEAGDGALLHDALPPGRAGLEGFFIARNLVSFAEYGEFLDALALDDPHGAAARAPRPLLGAPPIWRPTDGRYRTPFPDGSGREWQGDWPAVGISANDVDAYLAWRSHRDRRAYRLPTEWEWEKAGRGGDGRPYPWGDAPEPDFCRHAVPQAHPTLPVARGSSTGDASVYGVRDLAGAAREYTASHMADGLRVLRGGSWMLPFADCHLAARTPLTSSTPLLAVGFRLALGAPGSRVTDALAIAAEPDFRVPPTPVPEADLPEESISDDELTIEGRTVLVSQKALGQAGLVPRSDTSLPADAPLDIGPERYALFEEIARGSMGRVVLAYDRVLEREVALKIIHAHHQEDRISRYRFAMEARVSGRLQHCAIMPVYDLGTLPTGERFFAMTPVRGRSLADELKGRRGYDAGKVGNFSLDGLLTIFRRVCQGIAFAHARGIIHRDIKPANILLGEYGAVIIADLGLARIIQPHDADRALLAEVPDMVRGGRVTRIGSVIGTPCYMSPEQAMGLQDLVGPKSDVYGLGAMLYSILARQPPFTGSRVNQVLSKVRRGNPRPPSEVAPDRGVDPDLDVICLKALNLDPDDRHHSALELADVVAAFQDAARSRRHDAASAGERTRTVDEAVRRYKAARDKARRQRAVVGKWVQATRAAPSLEHRGQLWMAREALRELEARVDRRLVAVMIEARAMASADHLGAAERLGEVLRDRYARAERRADTPVRVHLGRLLRRLDSVHERWMERGAPVALQVDSSGVKVRIYRARDVARRQVADDLVYRGIAPCETPALPVGSHIAVLSRRDGRVRIPILIRRKRPVEISVKWPDSARLRQSFVYVAEGPFIAGDAQWEFAGDPQRLETLPAFQIAEHPVTWAEYRVFLSELGAESSEDAQLRSPRLTRDGPPLWGPAGELVFGRFSPRWPVTGISVGDAEAYCAWRSSADGVRYRLPTSLEWEKAARGVDGRRFPWGERYEPTYARPPRPGLHNVGAFAEDVSPYGVRDLASGVYEWTATAADGGGGETIVRGGCAAAPIHGAPCTVVMAWRSDDVSPFVGFRLVLPS